MNRQQFALIVALGLFVLSPLVTAGDAAKASDWKSAADENSGSTLSGVLYRNSADTSGSAPYALVDKWGVTRGYVAAADGVDLESSLGRQVTLQGTIRTLPGGDMPSMKGARIAGDNRDTAPATAAAASEERRRETSRAAAAAWGPVGVTPAPAAEHVRAVPLQEVVLEPQPDSLRDDNANPPRPAPARRVGAPAGGSRRARYPGERMAAYQEPIPAPHRAPRHTMSTARRIWPPIPVPRWSASPPFRRVRWKWTAP